MGPPLTLPVTLCCGWLRQRFEDRLISGRWDIEWAPHSPDFKYPRILPLGFCEGPSVRKQAPDNRWLEDGNYTRIRTIPIEECVRVTDNFARAACKCACNAKGVIWNTFWTERKSQTVWSRNWKLCGKIMHKLKLMCTKYEVFRWKHVEVISILEGSPSMLFSCPVLGWMLTWQSCACVLCVWILF